VTRTSNEQYQSVEAPVGRHNSPSTDSASQVFATAVPPPFAAPLTPLPNLPRDEDHEPQTHIVVDGDSLAKLAGRYLDDPRRSGEIFELNRDRLTNPDVLPIGVELTIPTRAGELTGRAPPQSQLPRAVAAHSSYGNGLIPVRPVPAASTLTPRARLAYPRNAE
jgi:hypothetical protein